MSMTQEEIDALIEGGVDNAVDEQETEVDVEENVIDASAEAILEQNNMYSSIDPKMEMLYDLQLPVSVELGRTKMLIREIMRLGRGSVVEFNKLVSEPVDVLVNGKKVAEGEVVVIDKHFGIRITTLVDPSDRLKGVKR